MRAPYADFLVRLRESLTGSQARLAPDVRRDIIEGRILEEPLNAYVVRVRANAASIGPEEIAQLKQRGLSEDEIFEGTVCAAYRAGVERYEAFRAVKKG
jgi:hypothetical protein